MFDRYLLEVQAWLLRPAAIRLAAQKIPADALTIGGFLFGVASAASIAMGHFGLGLVIFLLNRIFDGLDGAVARITGPTDRGAFLDIALDFLVYALIPFAFAFANPAANGLPASLLLTSFTGTASSFLAFAAIASKRGATSANFPRKGIYYLGGLTEGTETIVAFTAMCLWPDRFPAIAMIFSALAFVTMMMRWSWGWRFFSEPAS